MNAGFQSLCGFSFIELRSKYVVILISSVFFDKFLYENSINKSPLSERKAGIRSLFLFCRFIRRVAYPGCRQNSSHLSTIELILIVGIIEILSISEHLDIVERNPYFIDHGMNFMLKQTGTLEGRVLKQKCQNPLLCGPNVD